MAKFTHKAGSDRWKLLKSNGLICLGFALLCAFFPETVKTDGWELKSADAITSDRTRATVEERLFLLGIDDESLKVLDILDEDVVMASPELDAMSFGYPFPRSVYASLVRKLVGAGARLVVFDMLFLQEGAVPEEDAAFKAVLEEFPDRIVIGCGLDAARGGSSAYEDAAGLDRQKMMSVPPQSIIDWKGPDDPRVGFVTFIPDSDGVVRQTIGSGRMHDHEGSPVYHSLAMAALKQLGEEEKWPRPWESRHLHFPDFTSDVAVYEPKPFYSVFVDYDWEKSYKNGEVFKDKIVFVGGTSDAQFHDVFNAPHGVMLGARLQMNVLAAALHGDFYEVSGRGAEIASVFLMGLLGFVVATRMRRPLVGFAAFLFWGAVYLALVRGVYSGFDHLLPVFRPVATLLLSGIVCLVYQFAVSQVEKARLRRTLERQVSKELAAHILNQPEDYYNSLPGVRKPVTILFSDIRGFTTRSEKDDPVQLVKQLKEYLDAMCKVVFKYGGVVDKFIGDAVMAVWGNIKSEGPEQDAKNAVAAAVEMLERLHDLNEKWAAEGIDPYAIGIGLNHGDVIFGQVGSEEKQEMTVIGDPVNQAARLEGLTKKFGEGIVIGEKVAAFLGDRFRLRCIGAIRTKGKTEAAKLYGVRGNSMSGEDEDWMRRYHAGLEAFENGDVPAAAEIFRACAAEKPDDLVCPMYLEVIDAGEAKGGALTMKEK